MGMPGMPVADAGPTKKRVQVDVKLPMLNWTALPHGKIQGTVFAEINDEEIQESADFADFDAAFKLAADTKGGASFKNKTLGKGAALGPTNSSKTATLSKKDNSVLDMNRARNLGIAMRRVGMPPDDVMAAIADLDTSKIPPDKAELLRNTFMPTDEEVMLIKERLETSRKLAPIDDFMYQLHNVERGRQRLALMMKMETCEEAAKNIMPAAMSVLVASTSVQQSAKLKTVLQVTLAFGNRMNSNRRGGAWGFKLNVFDRLLDTKSTDRKRNLMNFVAQAIAQKDASATSFKDELIDLDVAAGISLADLKQQLQQATMTMKQVDAELAISPDNPHLAQFKEKYESDLLKAKDELAAAAEAFGKVMAYFAETTLSEPSAFFPVFVRLTKAFAEAEKQNAQFERQQLKAKEALEMKSRHAEAQQVDLTDGGGGGGVSSTTDGGGAEAGVDTLSQMQPRHHRGGVKQVQEVGDGTLDALIGEMKKQAFRRPEGHHKRSRRMSMRGGRDRGASGGNAYGAARPWLK